MPLPNVFTPAKRRVGRGRRHAVSSSPAPVAPLVLVAAELLAEAIQLTFDRAIALDDLNGSALRVDDNESATTYVGINSAVLIDPATVQITLMYLEYYSGGARILNAGANSGIVAVDDGGTWAGGEALPLPFP